MAPPAATLWDCTAGRFNWVYEAEETIYVIEGGVVIRDALGAARRLRAGDSYIFAAGARAEWHVEDYIRKFALIRTPLPRSLVLAKRGYRFLKRLIGNRRELERSPGHDAKQLADTQARGHAFGRKSGAIGESQQGAEAIGGGCADEKKTRDRRFKMPAQGRCIPRLAQPVTAPTHR